MRHESQKQSTHCQLMPPFSRGVSPKPPGQVQGADGVIFIHGLVEKNALSKAEYRTFLLKLYLAF